MSWCFAMVNGKLAKIFFERKKSGKVVMNAHCYVKESEYTTKREKQYIKTDIKKHRFSYRSKSTNVLRFSLENLLKYIFHNLFN